jgi:RNA polymerase sigma-70 factor (ECF subfamily)
MTRARRCANIDQKLNSNLEQKLDKKAEKKIVEAALQDLTAFSELYELYADKIYNYCYYKLYNTELANDITSEVFLKALNAFKDRKYKYDNAVGFGGWLYRVAHNAIVDYYKKSSTRKEIALDEGLSQSADNDVHEIETNLDAQEQMGKIQAFIKDFDDQTQTLLVLKFSEDYTFKHIAQLLDINESTVKMKYYRALEYIRKQFIAHT